MCLKHFSYRYIYLDMVPRFTRPLSYIVIVIYYLMLFMLKELPSKMLRCCGCQLAVLNQFSDHRKVNGLFKMDITDYMGLYIQVCRMVFGDIVRYLSSSDYKRNLKIGLSSVRKTYIKCVLTRNAHTCMYRSITSHFSALDPPLVEQYHKNIK